MTPKVRRVRLLIVPKGAKPSRLDLLWAQTAFGFVKGHWKVLKDKSGLRFRS